MWHPDPLLPPLKCMLISYQLSCEGSKLSALTEFPREFGDYCKNPSSNLLTVTLISGRIGCLVRKSQAEQPDNSWLSGQAASTLHLSRKPPGISAFHCRGFGYFGLGCILKLDARLPGRFGGRFGMSLLYSGVKGNLGKRSGCSVAFLFQ